MKLTKHWFLILLIILTIAVRLIPIFPDLFPFMYDHAKDALIILQMGTKFQPSLVGAVTSIPGVYYGPAWYYLALPLNILLNYHPLSSVLTVILLAAVGTWVAWKYLGKLEAAFWATATGIVGSQTSAWSPYLTPLVVLPILAILLNLKKKQTINWKTLSGLSLLTSLCFHFQPAFAVVLLPIVLLILFLLKVKSSIKTWLIAVLFFIIPFAPHAVFELRHDFHQSRQLVAFFTNYEDESRVVQANVMGLGRVMEIGNFVLSEAGNSVSPLNLPHYFFGLGVILWLGISGWLSHKSKTDQYALSFEERVVLLVFLIGTWGLYLLLPAKQYYLVAIIPVWLVLIARLIKFFASAYVKLIIVIVILLSLPQTVRSRLHFQQMATQDAILLAPKMKAVKKVYELSQDQPFASYQYLPELYDYPYQFIFRYLMRRGYSQPVEYSYAPGEVAHMSKVSAKITQELANELPKQRFLIIERPTYDFIFDEWWGRVAKPLDILEKHEINEAIDVYKAQPREEVL